MTAITDTKLILETLAGKTLANDKMLLIVNNYLTTHQDPAWAEEPDIDTLTNEELAQRFMSMALIRVKIAVKSGAEMKAREANDAAVATASDDSIVDL